ncbi:MAG: hypothetical protein RIC16_02300 [Rhodospirillales bacterium]
MGVPQPVADHQEPYFSDEDRDSLSILPLVIVPLESAALKRARMIKNSYLESVIELFNDEDVGRGHIYPAQVEQFFSDVSLNDTTMLEALAELPSYDVYSLRISLRRIGIEVDDHDHLRLSDSKQAELQSYMQPFLQKMTVNLFSEDSGAKVNGDWRNLFLHPDVRVTKRRLRAMSEKLGIPVEDVPAFLEDYGDVYLSVAYYRQCLDAIRPVILDFLRATSELLAHRQLSRDYGIQKNCTTVKTKVERISRALQQQFDGVSRSTDAMWSDMDAQTFESFRQLVEGGHDRIGALLCTLTVKMNAWAKKFPADDRSGPMRHADFITTEMRRGW